MKLTIDETTMILLSLEAWKQTLLEADEEHYLVPDIEALEERFGRSRKQKIQWGSPTHKGRINVEAEKTFMKYYYNPDSWPDHIKTEAEMVSLLRERYTQLANN
jgi:hypothetical protein